MSRSLPPLNALRAFESAGRHLSFTKAAAELNVTPAAVSHQIKTLEAYLDIPLFVRLARGLSLTGAGQAALATISQGFDHLAHGVEQIQAHRFVEPLTVSVSPSFGSMWLVPRLNRFRSRHPEIDVRIDGTDERVDLARDRVDLALRYGPGGYTGVRVDHLFSQVNTPVCSPALVTGRRAIKEPDDLRNHTLLHIEWKDAEPSWRMWLLAAGLSNIDATRGPVFTMESMAIQAARDGHGVALVGNILVADDLTEGKLVHPFESRLSTPLSFSYYLLSEDTRAQPARVVAFREWLVEEAKEFQLQHCSGAAGDFVP